MAEFTTKGGAKPTHIERFTITCDELAHYLERDVLGIPVKADFVTTHGVAGGCFVVMDIALDDADLTSAPQTGNYVDTFLSKNSSGVLFKQDILTAIEPFMFPEDYSKIISDPVRMKQLADIGILGATFNHIRQHCRFRKSETHNMWAIALNTENLIRDFFSNPTTGKVDGELKIVSVTGDKAPAIQWEIEINRDNVRSIDSLITVDAIFKSIR